ncbi:DNA mismatch repair protein MutS [Paenibacillus sp. JX-17]|uniref:DNA mismatch repair protein MutS n=1 Tax=Paenibacillus lacisoli TaxID=3064525 RepID=A0ABT9CF24_9BACL|nr:DNA mismatch repair protein MutS [Paenibacillus sp. JX-17]MDO7907874.1 DNA mismatch repair protein MutS [Paenibacillus sp. JX-17]
MNETYLERLQYHQIKNQLTQCAVSYLGKQHIQELRPFTGLRQVEQQLHETSEAMALLKQGASVPIPSLEGIEWVLGILGSGYVLTEQDFGHIQQFLRSCRQLIRYMDGKSAIAPTISSYTSSMHELGSLLNAIEESIYSGRVTDTASKELARVRKKIAVMEDRLKRRLDALLIKHREIMQDALISQRNGRYVLPVKKEHRRLVSGMVVDESASGQTVFIEPAEISSLQMELSSLRAEEGREETKVLSALTEQAERYAYELQLNADTVGVYDYILARGKLGLRMNARTVEVNEQGIIQLRQARHPLLGDSMVPLDFAMGHGYKTLIITGPNTGGKTLCLKTVGLLTLMVQSGLLVPVGEGSQFAIFDEVAVDIGDGQSLEQALSTFSAHIRNMNQILAAANPSTLVLIDEMASGTDPGEGVGLSIAILEELYQRGTTVVVTTHFTEIKSFAAATPGFQNARMEFDTETLEPLYRLTIGEAGRSYAFEIASKLGFPPALLARSQEITLSATISKPVIPRMESPVSHEAPVETAVEKKPEASHTLPAGQTRQPLQIGDSVYIHYLRRTGIVYETEDTRGQVGVMIQKQKLKINRKRLTLHIPGSELYPDQYDLDIVLDSKENRKKRKLLSRKHVEGLTIEKPSDENWGKKE